MVATPAAVYDAANPAALAESRLREMERFAESGDWGKVESLLKRLPQLITRIPISARREILLAAYTSVERLRERVVLQSNDVSTQLATIKTGRQAAESYRITSAMSKDARL